MSKNKDEQFKQPDSLNNLSKKKKDKEEVKAITIMFPISVYKAVKYKAFDEGTTFKRVVVDCVKEVLELE